MCFRAPKAPKPPKPPPPPDPRAAEFDAEQQRRRIMARKGYAASIATSPTGVANFGQSSQTPSLSSGSAKQLGVG